MSFACRELCRKLNSAKIRRPHFTCLFCRLRRWHYGKLNQKKGWHVNRFMDDVVMPPEYATYVMIIDLTRRFAKVKGALLKRLLTICEWLAN